MIKKILNSKDENAYDYNFIFDDMIKKYSKIEEEFDIIAMETNEKQLIGEMKRADITKKLVDHDNTTMYHKWKNTKSTN
jgi:hypothetical protein